MILYTFWPNAHNSQEFVVVIEFIHQGYVWHPEVFCHVGGGTRGKHARRTCLSSLDFLAPNSIGASLDGLSVVCLSVSLCTCTQHDDRHMWVVFWLSFFLRTSMWYFPSLAKFYMVQTVPLFQSAGVCGCVGVWVCECSLKWHACMHIYIYAYRSTCMHSFIHAYTCTDLQAYIHTYILTYTRTYKQTCEHAFTYTTIHKYTQISMHA